MTKAVLYARSAVVSLMLSAILAGCGFHPRGSVTRITDLGSIYVDASRDLSIAEAVRVALSDAAFVLARNRDDAAILLRLTEEEQGERVVSVNSTGRVSEFELSHAVKMLIAESVDGNTSAYSQNQNFNRVEVFREYTYDETNVLGKQNEARILRAEMKEELVRQIVLRTNASLARSVSALSINDPVRHIAPFDHLYAVDNLAY